MKQRNRFPQRRNPKRSCFGVRTEVRRRLHWHEECVLAACQQRECEWQRAWDLSDTPIQRELTKRGDLTSCEAQLTARRKDSECNRKIKGATTLSKISGGEVHGDATRRPGESRGSDRRADALACLANGGVWKTHDAHRGDPRGDIYLHLDGSTTDAHEGAAGNGEWHRHILAECGYGARTVRV
jgi:hypothetical protein